MRERLQVEKATGGASLPWSLRRVTVSKVFWDAVHQTFPGLQKHPGYPATFWYLIFGTWCDDDTGRLLLCADIVSEFQGRNWRNHSHTDAEGFLLNFKRDVLPKCGFEVTGWNVKKCRQLRTLALGAFEDCLADERRGRWDDGEHVYLDGSTATEKRQRRRRREQQEVANRMAAACSDAETIRAYLNGRTSHLFTRAIQNNYSHALEAARALPDANTANMQQRMLRYIRAQPQPFYAPSPKGNTVRLFASDSIPNLQGGVRRALTRGWAEADLRCSQLAICAWLWHVPIVTEFLRSGANIWNYLCDASGIRVDQRELAKPIIKKWAVYPICFGMEEHYVLGLTTLHFMRAGISREAARALVQNPIIRALFSARDDAAECVNKRGGGETCYGKECPVTAERNAACVLAEMAQAWEMKIIFPAFALAEQSRSFAITLFQHDGFSVHFHERPDLWKARIAESVNAAARREGIITQLEWKEEETRETYKRRAGKEEK